MRKVESAQKILYWKNSFCAREKNKTARRVVQISQANEGIPSLHLDIGRKTQTDTNLALIDLLANCAWAGYSHRAVLVLYSKLS